MSLKRRRRRPSYEEIESISVGIIFGRKPPSLDELLYVTEDEDIQVPEPRTEE
jgi:hypothetical protein